MVRLMTIHQAKGLEFPVVIVPDLDRRPHSAGSGVAFTAELGPLGGFAMTLLLSLTTWDAWTGATPAARRLPERARVS